MINGSTIIENLGFYFQVMAAKTGGKAWKKF